MLTDEDKIKIMEEAFIKNHPKAHAYGHKIRNSDCGYTIQLPYDFVKPLIDTKLINYSYYKDGEFTVDGIDYCYKCGVDLDHDGHDVGSGCDPEWRCREWKEPQICPKCGEYHEGA